jgi:hypothetical protein
MGKRERRATSGRALRGYQDDVGRVGRTTPVPLLTMLLPVSNPRAQRYAMMRPAC